MRPVTPFMMMPTVWTVRVLMILLIRGARVSPCIAADAPAGSGGASTPARGSVPSSSWRQWATSPAGP